MDPPPWADQGGNGEVKWVKQRGAPMKHDFLREREGEQRKGRKNGKRVRRFVTSQGMTQIGQRRAHGSPFTFQATGNALWIGPISRGVVMNDSNP